ncbi:MAG: type I secretion system permease/ATPase [Alphaproteobacteria bacterium]
MFKKKSNNPADSKPNDDLRSSAQAKANQPRTSPVGGIGKSAPAGIRSPGPAGIRSPEPAPAGIRNSAPSNGPPPLGMPVGSSQPGRSLHNSQQSSAANQFERSDSEQAQKRIANHEAMQDVGMPIEDVLEQLTHLMRDPVGKDVIRAGLPLEQGMITQRAHERAIKQAGLKSITNKTFKGSNGAATPFLISFSTNKVAVGLRWNVDGSLDVMGLDREQDGKASIRQIPPAKLRGFLPKKVVTMKRVAKAVRKSSDNTKLTGLNRFENWFWPVFKAQWPGYVYACIATVLVNFMTVLGSFYALQIYDRVLPTFAFDTLWTLTIGVMIAHTFGFIVKNLQSHFLDTAGRRIDLRVSSDLFTRVMAIKAKDRPKNSGSFAQTFRDFENVREFFASITMSTVVEIPFSLIFVTAIFLVAGPLGYIPLLCGPLLIAFTLLSQIWISRSISDSLQAGSEKNAVLIESLSGIETIKALNAESVFQHRWEDAVEVAADTSRIMRLVSGLSNSLGMYIQSIATVLVLVFGVVLASNQSISQGGIIAATMLTGRALQPYLKLTGLLSRFQQVKMSLSVVERLSTQESEWASDAGHIDQQVENGAIAFSKVSFSYPDTSSSVFEDVSFDIQPGERVGIIGPSGSGKSTLSKLILGIYEPDNGSVMIGGIDNRQYNPRTLRRSVGYSPQDPFIFGGTLAENIQFGNDQAGQKEILMASKQAGVDIFTANHPDGMSLQVGELGRNLSGGQRQALSLARTFIKDSPIIVLDEPTNSLDGQTEAILLNTLRNQPKERTVILITHRPALLQVVDRLICMDKGRVIMDGGRDEVIQRLGGQIGGGKSNAGAAKAAASSGMTASGQGGGNRVSPAGAANAGLVRSTPPGVSRT